MLARRKRNAARSQQCARLSIKNLVAYIDFRPAIVVEICNIRNRISISWEISDDTRTRVFQGAIVFVTTQAQIIGYNNQFAKSVVIEVGNGRSGTASQGGWANDFHLRGACSAINDINIGVFNPVCDNIRNTVVVHVSSHQGGVGAGFCLPCPLYTQRNLTAGWNIVTVGIAGCIIKIVALACTGAILVVTVDQSVAIVVDTVIAVFDRLAVG